jgi:FixJ family two-component response regulator
VQTFASPGELLAAVDRNAMACLVLDLAMPEMSGLQLQDLLADRRLSLPIVFLTGRGDIPATVQAMRHGAVDFLTKPVEDDTLLSAVKLALARAREMQLRERSLSDIRERLAALTGREHQVLQRVVLGLLNKQIAADLGTTEKTIKFHRGNLMRKLAVRSVAELVRLTEQAAEPVRAAAGGRDDAHSPPM